MFKLIFILSAICLGNILAQNCGLPVFKPIVNGNILNRIIYGENARDKSWPWMVSLLVMNQGRWIQNCGGTLIDNNLVLTAANCLIGRNPSDIIVVVGVTDLRNIPASSIYYVSRYVYHSSFSKATLQNGNDIGLIRLTRNVTLSNSVGIICLPPERSSNAILNRRAVFTGWGWTSQYGSPAAYLQQTQLTIINGNGICNALGYYNSNLLYCALDPSKYSNICFGDAGGSLMYNINGRWYLYGFASYLISFNYGTACYNSYPSYFTKVPEYISFINNAKRILK